MLDKSLTYAIVGASYSPEKYGHRVFKDLLDSGHRAIPINPKGGELLGSKVYSSLGEYGSKIDVAVFVVPPKITLSIIPEAVKLGITKIWMQPGSESDEAIALCRKLNVDYVAHACIMIERKIV